MASPPIAEPSAKAKTGAQKTSNHVPAKVKVGASRKTEKRPAKPAKLEVARPAKTLLVDTQKIDEGDLADELFNFARRDQAQNLDGWRTEWREYKKQDGTISIYFNYRARKSIKLNGKRFYPYRKGGRYDKE